MSPLRFKSSALVMAYVLIALPLLPLAQNAPALRPLAPKPGHLIGRVVDMQGQAITNVEISVVGALIGALVFEPDIDTRTGYYEIELPDDLYRVHASFNRASNDRRPSTVECLLNSLEEFVSLDGKSPNTRAASKKGIVKDFVYAPRGC